MMLNNSVIRVLIDTVVLPYLVREDTWDKVEDSVDELLVKTKACILEFVEHATTAAILPLGEQLPDDVTEAISRRTEPGITEQDMGASPEFFYSIDGGSTWLKTDPS